jgi:hypothetical protein
MLNGDAALGAQLVALDVEVGDFVGEVFRLDSDGANPGEGSAHWCPARRPVWWPGK